MTHESWGWDTNRLFGPILKINKKVKECMIIWSLITFTFSHPQPVPSWKVMAQNLAGVTHVTPCAINVLYKAIVVCCFALFYYNSEKIHVASLWDADSN